MKSLKLRNIETNQIVATKKQIAQSLYCSLNLPELSPDSCGLFELNAHIEKEGFNNSAEIFIHLYVMIPENRIINDIATMQKHINESNKNIILTINLNDNIWESCLKTELKIKINKNLCQLQQ